MITFCRLKFCSNNHGDTALALLRRRGIEKAAIRLLEPYEQDEAIGMLGLRIHPNAKIMEKSCFRTVKHVVTPFPEVYILLSCRILVFQKSGIL